jgi:hypothetical protein
MTPVCAACGVVAPAKQVACEACGQPLAQPRVFAPEAGDLYFCAARAAFTCRACDFPSPVDGLESREGIDCAQCGSLQRFDRGVWDAALLHAHAVGDLGGPNPEGRVAHPVVWIGDDNPHKALGVTATFSKHEGDRFTLEASPGWPVCRPCRALLVCELAGNAIATRCPRCGAQARYAVPEAVGIKSPFVAGVVSEENRVDRPEVRVQATASGPVTLHCPQCGAAVQPGAGNTVTCTYCNTVALIPPRARPRDKGSIVKPTVFWVALRGRSAARAALEKPQEPAKAGKVTDLFTRGLSALPGIELAPRKPGLDARQLAVTLGSTALAMGAGYALFQLLLGGR